MKSQIYYLFTICMLLLSCNKKPSYQIPQYKEESDSVVSDSSIVIDDNKETTSPQKSNVFCEKKELANDYGWTVYIDGTFNPYDSCYSDFKLYIENNQTQEQRIIMECQEGNAKLPIKGEEWSSYTIEVIKEVHLLSSKRMLIIEEYAAMIVDIESLSFVKYIHTPFGVEFSGIVDSEWNETEETRIFEIKTVDDITLDVPRIYTRRYNSDGEMIYEDETIIIHDNPNPIIPKETGILSNKIQENTSNLPINAEKVAEGYGWIVYKYELQNVEKDEYEDCDALKLYIENKNSHKLYLLLETRCGSQKGTRIDVQKKGTIEYVYSLDCIEGNFQYVEVLSHSKLLLQMSDVRNLYDYVIDLETFSVIFIDYGVEATYENGQTYLIYWTCNERLGKYQSRTRRYDIYGNFLHEEVTTVLYPTDYQVEGDCF